MKHMEQIKFLIEEYHRNEWQPLMLQGSDNKVQRRVMITQDQANLMNVNSNITRLRYVKAVEVTPIKEIEVIEEEVVVVDDKAALQAQYQEKFDKKPFHGWDADKLREKLNA